MKIADMHTHSEHSHDSSCKIEEMAQAQINKGTTIFAVTNHFDTHVYSKTEIFEPIAEAYDESVRLSKIYKDKCTILSGVEISEGFWYPEIYNRIINMKNYDVVLGSVHCVQFENMREPYSKIDFSAFSKETIENYLDAYFDDILEMLEKIDLDILTHLECPLRYINGRYKMGISLEKYSAKIEEIFEEIISRGIALELNTSSVDVLGDFMPNKSMLKKYYDMGGRLITLGSDAHKSSDASRNFQEAIEELKQIGFKSIYYFIAREPFQVEI